MTQAGFYPAQQGADAHGVLLLVRNQGDIAIITEAGDSVTPLWLPMANVTNVSSPKMSKTFHDVTPSIPGAWKEVVPGFKDAGTVSLTVLFNSDLGSHSYLLTSYKNDTKEIFRLWIPERIDSTNIEDDRDYIAFVDDLSPTLTSADRLHLIEEYKVSRIGEYVPVRLDQAGEGASAKFWEFEGYVAGVSTSHSAGGIIVGNLSLRLTGQVKFESLSSGAKWLGVQ